MIIGAIVVLAAVILIAFILVSGRERTLDRLVSHPHKPLRRHRPQDLLGQFHLKRQPIKKRRGERPTQGQTPFNFIKSVAGKHTFPKVG